MATPVYSRLLGSVVNATVGGFHSLGGPSAGYVWVVRDIRCWNNGVWPQALGSILVTDGQGIPIFARAFPLLEASHQYGGLFHQCIEPGDVIQYKVDAAQWAIRVSGFQLTLP